ncbi:signal peptidase I [Porphyrobacter sp. HT-58-2]|uniref:signal peptidase I n=1 Tax=Porphyrobacter sp. HT-58-2 TaxID=2023229 RepID=UPI000CDC9087|nr:signal peptidase I [Porphyrobacter sp. HT-58-2]AUX69766.1 signal peptidase I [Porphyrobacter sp. HT-58-2]
MDVKTQSLRPQPHAARTVRPGDTWGGFFWFIIKLLLVVLAFRVFVFSPFSIPSESMLPRLMNGDYLLAAKWPYGISRHSLPIDLPLPEGRLFARPPERGDIVIFKHPVDGRDYIKRVIGLPGDSVAVINGEVVLNGERLPRQVLGDAIIPLSPNTACAWGGRESADAEGNPTCRYTRLRETLPGGRAYDVLDFGSTPYDGFAPVKVPAGTMFVMGDNRDSSRDSRFAAAAGDGVGLVPQDLLVGRASVIVWSSDGSADWGNPWTWFTAARWERIGSLL